MKQNQTLTATQLLMSLFAIGICFAIASHIDYLFNQL